MRIATAPVRCGAALVTLVVALTIGPAGSAGAATPQAGGLAYVAGGTPHPYGLARYDTTHLVGGLVLFGTANIVDATVAPWSVPFAPQQRCVPSACTSATVSGVALTGTTSDGQYLQGTCDATAVEFGQDIVLPTGPYAAAGGMFGEDLSCLVSISSGAAASVTLEVRPLAPTPVLNGYYLQLG
jgi:hypothetical protein